MIVWVLVGAAVVFGRLQEWIDAAAIVVLNALLGFVHEYGSLSRRCWFVYSLFGMKENVDRARTIAFTGLVPAQLFHVFNCRSDRHSITVGFWTNKPLVLAVGVSILLQAIIILIPWARPIFGVTLLDPVHWALVAGIGVTPLLRHDR